MHRYMDAILALSTENLRVRHTMLQIQHMLLPPSALFAPPILLRALSRLLRRPPARPLSLAAPLAGT